jgi:uncharacterized protein YehS (DUF1456 family)
MVKVKSSDYFNNNDTSMIHNDVLRRIRFALSINDNATVQLFKMVDYDMPLDYLKGIMLKEEESGYVVPRCFDY